MRNPGYFKALFKTLFKTTAFAMILAVTVSCGKTVGGPWIDVDTFKGVVTLSGRVKSQTQRDQAIGLARGIDGVTEVKDAMQVIPE